jgi:hypothetical protein
MSIPKNVVESNIEIIIDGGLTPVLHANYSLNSDSLNTWIYFAFHHSKHEITVVPEFLPLIMSLVLILETLHPLIPKTKMQVQPIGHLSRIDLV